MNKLYLFTVICIYIRKLIYLSLWSFDRMIDNNSKIVIFAYHAFSNDDWKYSVDVKKFKDQILYLKNEGYKFIKLSVLLNDMSKFSQSKDKYAVITVDDGYKNVLNVKDFIKKERISPTLFMLGNTQNANRAELDTNYDFMNVNDVRQLINDGWEIGSHSLTHSNLTKLSHKEIINEVENSKKIISSKYNVSISYFAYPRGKYDDNVLKAVKNSNYSAGLSMNDGKIDKNINMMLIPRIGVDRTHGSIEFKTIYSPSVIKFRQLIKSTFIGGYL